MFQSFSYITDKKRKISFSMFRSRVCFEQLIQREREIVVEREKRGFRARNLRVLGEGARAIMTLSTDEHGGRMEMDGIELIGSGTDRGWGGQCVACRERKHLIVSGYKKRDHDETDENKSRR